mgnify:CR=1 FL=1
MVSILTALHIKRVCNEILSVTKYLLRMDWIVRSKTEKALQYHDAMQEETKNYYRWWNWCGRFRPNSPNAQTLCTAGAKELVQRDKQFCESYQPVLYLAQH